MREIFDYLIIKWRIFDLWYSEVLIFLSAALQRKAEYTYIRKYSFSMRITNVWNSLPFSVVTAPSVNSFKNRLDKHWALLELKYDWEAELSGTGSRSRVEF